MAKFNGTLYLAYVDGDAIGSTTTANMEVEIDMPDTTSKDSSAWAEHLSGGGLRNASGSFEGFFDPSNSTNFTELWAHVNARTDFAFKLATATASNMRFSGNCTLSNLSFEAGLEEAVTISGSYKVNGAAAFEVGS